MMRIQPHKAMRKTLLVLVFICGCGAPSDNHSTRQIIESTKAPKAIGPYSQAVRVGPYLKPQQQQSLYLSGQIAIDPRTGKMVEGGISEQTHQVLTNIRAVLEEAGFSLKNVVQSQVFLSDMDNYGAMNEVYSTFFPESPPARAAVEVARLPLDALVEIMVTAVKAE